MSPPSSTSDERIKALHTKAARLHADQCFADEAEVWREICRLDLHNPYWLHNLALALLHSDQLDECLPLFARLLKEAPDLSRVHNNFAMAALRLGAPAKFVVPHFIQALVLCDDQSEFYRHFMNCCNSIVYGFDDHTEAEAALKVIDGYVARLVEDRCEPAPRQNNVEYLARLVDIYRGLARFRSFFAHKNWPAADRELTVAQHELRQMGLDNFVQGLTHIHGTFELARDVASYLESAASGVYSKPKDALPPCEALRNRCQARNNEHDKYCFFERVKDLLAEFLDGLMIAFRYLSTYQCDLREIERCRKNIHTLSIDCFCDLGHDLLTTLQAVERVCSGIFIGIARRANQDLASNATDLGWKKICLLFGGLHLDFSSVDVALARGYIGWIYEPRRECIRVLNAFKTFVERQAWRDIYVNDRPQENIARALLQAFLLPRNYREIPVRGGRSDVLMFEMDKRFVFELKIWRGHLYVHSGVSELREYIEGEQDGDRLACSFYLIFDPTLSRRADAYIALHDWSARLRKEDIEVMVVGVALGRPSEAFERSYQSFGVRPSSRSAAKATSSVTDRSGRLRRRLPMYTSHRRDKC